MNNQVNTLQFNKSSLIELNDQSLHAINSGATPSSSAATSALTPSSPWCIGGAFVIGLTIGITSQL